MSDVPLLNIVDLVKHFPLGGGILAKPKGWVKAVDGVSFAVSRGESFGLVGESGCGKTTLGRLILRLIDPSGGRIEFDGQNIGSLNASEMMPLRRRMQIIFQDPYSSLDPRMKIDAIVTEPLRAIQPLTVYQRREAAAELLEKVGLRKDDLNKYPHEFSGGQRQRIGIARALCVRPELIVADEPVSALDVSIQAQVINLLDDLKEEFNLSYVFISHDLSIVEHICDRIAVMYLGTVVEVATTEDFSKSPRHPYTRALLLAVPIPDPHRRAEPFPIEGDVPSPIDPPAGCTFHPRCPHAFERCSQQKPPLAEAANAHFVACWLNEGAGMTNDD
ncbi:MAG: oligopeptide/dipeptide ABC transporter ATP-binding protein [Desulfobacteraceae bacterium]|nr:oligopeptide/dipeptide ABC transporter ATP-binding protein [Desulfobacteraceae bacterium]